MGFTVTRSYRWAAELPHPGIYLSPDIELAGLRQKHTQFSPIFRIKGIARVARCNSRSIRASDLPKEAAVSSVRGLCVS